MNKVKGSAIEKKVLLMIFVAALILLAGGAALGVWSAGQMRETVKQQFNEEQLVIARNIASLIEREFKLLKRELAVISRDLPPEPFSPQAPLKSIQKTLARIVESGVRNIEIIDIKTRKSYIYLPYKRWHTKDASPQNLDDFPLPQTTHAQNVRVTRPQIKDSEISLMLVASLPGNFPKHVIFNVNLSWFLTPLLKNARSGKTGYGWIIDENGYFLFHPDAAFIGKNAFEIRESKYSDISFEKINFIQKDEMLKGHAGTGWYVSGWHRGITGKIEKLIAFCPVFISDTPLQKWSVAMVAPVLEVETFIKSGYRRQYLLQILILLIIILGASTLILMEKRWSKILGKKVKIRTEALQRSEEKYRSLVESAEDFIFTVNLAGNFQSMNSFTANFFGGSPDEFLGKHLSTLFFPAKLAEKQLMRVQQVYDTGKSVRDEFELTLGKHQIWINANFMPLKNKAGKVNTVLCIARDITENKNLERQLVNAEKLASLGTLAAGVAHEINNPMGVILGFCDLLLQKTEKGTQTHGDLKIIERQGLHCKEVVENLLSFARLNKESSEYAGLNLCLGEIISVVKHTLEMNDIELITRFAPEIPPAKGDPRQLQQVFLNLINNAVAAMEYGGILTIRTYLDRGGRKAVVQFKDTGTGIAPEHMDHIFEPFFTTKPEGKGTGLGLFVSYGIVAKYGGTIDCVSHTANTSEGSMRTTFTIMLPTR